MTASRATATSLVRRLPRTTIVVGKGGVGKTTAAAALALESSRSVGRTLVLTTDPARALPTVLAHAVGFEAASVGYASGLQARALDAATSRARFMERWGRTIAVILDRGTYLDDEDIASLVDTALPGSDEIFAALELAELLAGKTGSEGIERIIVDTAPTGHTLRLPALPQTFRALIGLLDTMQGKHRLMVRALTRGYRPDAADAFLAEMTRIVDVLGQALVDEERCAAVIITNPAALVLDETRRYLAALNDLRVHVAAVIWNASASHPDHLDVATAPHYIVPTLERSPVGRAGLDAWLEQMRPAAGSRSVSGVEANVGSRSRASGDVPIDLATVLRPLTIVAGKGGVGKTTVALALALRSASAARTLVVSTDPAPSLGDALGQAIGDEDAPVTDVPRLFARQMDASAAFDRLRSQYQARVDALFDGLVGTGVELGVDRAIVRDLLALAPPGVDEVYALSLLSDALFERRYERVIVDPAPTGHLLRLLEMPSTALAWSHQLLRLMLKYREIGGLGDTASDVLAFARNLRALDALLHDPSRAAVIVVTLDEEVVAAETKRLVAEIGSRGIAVSGVILNRSSEAVTFPPPGAPVHLQAPLWTPPPAGPARLVDWSQTWVPLTS